MSLIYGQDDGYNMRGMYRNRMPQVLLDINFPTVGPRPESNSSFYLPTVMCDHMHHSLAFVPQTLDLNVTALFESHGTAWCNRGWITPIW